MKRIVVVAIVLVLAVLAVPSVMAQSAGPKVIPPSRTVPGYAISSSKHYRESGVGNATGRAGGATMTARALFGKDGNTAVEITTGALDSSAQPPGAIGQVQFKPLNGSNGNALFAHNYQPSTSSGYYSFTTNLLHRGQQAQLQGSITGIDRNRTDVVTVVETTKLRPDLAVLGLTLEHVPDGITQGVWILANVAEVNGDASATTTCQLAIDGSVVDQAGIYVDAGGSVTCAFLYRFTSTGSHTIQVTAANVVPADWDTSNNSASGTIEIVPPGSRLFHAYGNFDDQDGFLPSRTETATTWLGGNIVWDYSNTYAGSGVVQQRHAQIFSEGGPICGTSLPVFWFPATVTYTESMDGTQASAFTTTVDAQHGGDETYGLTICDGATAWEWGAWASGVADGHLIYITDIQYLYPNNWIDVAYELTYVDVFSNAGDVTYFSSGYVCRLWGSCSGDPSDSNSYYMWNSSDQQQYGNRLTPGSTWTPSILVQDDYGNRFSGSISVPLVSHPVVYSTHDCWTWDWRPDYDAYGHGCQDDSANMIETTGSASN